MPAVELVDVVVVPVAEADRWYSRWREEYLPGAQRRGMSLKSVAWAHHGGDCRAVRITWRLPNPYAFYAMRSAAKVDPEVGRFWAATDAVAVSRHRQAFEQEVDL